MDSKLPEAPAIADCDTATTNWTPIYDAFIARLRAAGVGRRAPKPGERFPAFALPDDRGRYRTLGDLLGGGPLVLSFNRGGWCPYCRAELAGWAERLGALGAANGRFVSIAGEVGGRAERLHAMIGAAAAVLCDVDHGLALALGLAFCCDADLQRRYRACGLDLAEIYGGGGGFLPVPATFVLDRDGIVRFAFVDPDFRQRADPDTVLAAVRALAAAG
mgnify:CR=1 FL=1